MFGDLLGNLEKQQEEMRQNLAGMEHEASVGDGFVRVKISGDRQIKSIHIDPSRLQEADVEELEDFLLVAINRATEWAIQKEKEEADKLLKNNLPPGMGNISDFFS